MHAMGGSAGLGAELAEVTASWAGAYLVGDIGGLRTRRREAVDDRDVGREVQDPAVLPIHDVEVPARCSRVRPRASVVPGMV